MTYTSIYHNKKLEELIKNCELNSRLDLRKIKLTDSDIEILITEAIRNKQPTMLWLVDNQLTSHGLSRLCSLLDSNITLEGLALSHNHITDNDLISLTKLLSNKISKINRLALTSNEITDQGLKYLCDMLKINQTLTQLWLGYNHITDSGVQLLMNVLIDQNQTLEVLSLSWNNFITDVSVDSIIDMLEQNQKIKVLCLANCNLSDTSKIKLRKATKLFTEFYLDL